MTDTAPSSFTYSRWRHGGWYVSETRWPNGGCGCVSNNYDDKKWRIACDPRPFEEQPTFRTRADAALAEWHFVRTLPREAIPEAPLPGIDWRSIARDLAGALSSCTDQIGQMRGMFDDKDGMIQESLDDADKAMADYTAAVNGSTAAPGPRTIWTCTTEGDNCQLTTTVHATQAEAFERVRDDLRADCKPTQLDHLNAMPAADMPGAWEDKNDGPCMIESHEVPPCGRDETDQEFEDRLLKQEAADNLRLIDFISDKIGLPHDEELSRENFLAWLAQKVDTPASV